MLALLYHTQHSTYQEDLPFWLGLAAQSGDPVLELGCGTGRVLIPLAEAGYRVTGIDKDLSMLKFLQMNIDESQKPKPLLIAADMRRFSLGIKFPLVILPCNTFSTLNDNERKDCLQCIGMALMPGGTFAVSLANPVILRHLPARSEVELEDEYVHHQTGNPVQVSSSWRRNNHIFTVTWFYDHLLPDGTVQRLAIKNVHHMASLEKLTEEFKRAGFLVTNVYGDFDHSKYTEDSPHLIILTVHK